MPPVEPHEKIGTLASQLDEFIPLMEDIIRRLAGKREAVNVLRAIRDGKLSGALHITFNSGGVKSTDLSLTI